MFLLFIILFFQPFSSWSKPNSDLQQSPSNSNNVIASSFNTNSQNTEKSYYKTGNKYLESGDFKKAAENFRKSIEHKEAHYLGAIMSLSVLYRTGQNGVEKNTNKSIEYLNTLASNSYLDAEIQLADIYYNGSQDLQVEQNLDKAKKLYLSALNSKHSVKTKDKILLALGQIEYSQENSKKALEYLNQIVKTKRKHTTNDIIKEANHVIGKIYYENKESKDISLEFLSKSNKPESHFLIATILEKEIQEEESKTSLQKEKIESQIKKLHSEQNELIEKLPGTVGKNDILESTKKISKSKIETLRKEVDYAKKMENHEEERLKDANRKIDILNESKTFLTSSLKTDFIQSNKDLPVQKVVVLLESAQSKKTSNELDFSKLKQSMGFNKKDPLSKFGNKYSNQNLIKVITKRLEQDIPKEIERLEESLETTKNHISQWKENHSNKLRTFEKTMTTFNSQQQVNASTSKADKGSSDAKISKIKKEVNSIEQNIQKKLSELEQLDSQKLKEKKEKMLYHFSISNSILEANIKYHAYYIINNHKYIDDILTRAENIKSNVPWWKLNDNITLEEKMKKVSQNDIRNASIQNNLPKEEVRNHTMENISQLDFLINVEVDAKTDKSLTTFNKLKENYHSLNELLEMLSKNIKNGTDTNSNQTLEVLTKTNSITTKALDISEKSFPTIKTEVLDIKNKTGAANSMITNTNKKINLNECHITFHNFIKQEIGL